MFILSTGETTEPSKETGKLEGILEKEICKSWVFKELNFTKLFLSISENKIGKIKTRGNSKSKSGSRIDMS